MLPTTIRYDWISRLIAHATATGGQSMAILILASSESLVAFDPLELCVKAVLRAHAWPICN